MQQGVKSVPREAFQRDTMIHEEHCSLEPKALKAKVKWEMDISETFDDNWASHPYVGCLKQYLLSVLDLTVL